MKAIFMTSGPNFSVKKEDGTRKAIRIDNADLVLNLKKEI